MKIIIIIVLNVIVCLIAMEYKKCHKRKIEFYNSAVNYAKDLTSYISFNKNTAHEIFTANIGNYSKIFVTTLQEYFKDKEFNSDCLNSVELIQINDFISSLGKYDIEETLKIINFHKLKFEQKVENLKESSKKKVEPVFKIIIILGIVLSIIIL